MTAPAAPQSTAQKAPTQAELAASWADHTRPGTSREDKEAADRWFDRQTLAGVPSAFGRSAPQYLTKPDEKGQRAVVDDPDHIKAVQEAADALRDQRQQKAAGRSARDESKDRDRTVDRSETDQPSWMAIFFDPDAFSFGRDDRERGA